MNALPTEDLHHLQAAQGWLELGNHLEANEELDKITPQLRAHPAVLALRWSVSAMAKKWEASVDIAQRLVNLSPESPFGWIHRSFALHELKRTQEAFDLLLPAAQRFPDDETIPYNLACYECQSGRLNEANVWLEKAFKLGNPRAITLRALEDPDLKPLWKNIGQ